MNRTIAIIRNGRVELPEPVDWPDGTRVEVTPVESKENDSESLDRWPVGFFEKLREDWGSEPFERSSQGESETREEW